MHPTLHPFDATPAEERADAEALFELGEISARRNLTRHARRNDELIARGTHVRAMTGVRPLARRLALRALYRGRATGLCCGRYVVLRAGRETVRLPYW